MSTIRDHLQAIRDEFGSLNAELVADVAADEAHPLHAHVYDCAPAEASRRYYVTRAAQLLRVTFRPDPTKPTELRAFVAVKGEDTPRAEYVPSAEALADPFTRELVLRSMDREWKAFKRRYQHMQEYAALIRSEVQEIAS